LLSLSLSLVVSLSLRNLSSLFPPLPQSLEKKMKTSSFVFLLVVIILSFSLLASSSEMKVGLEDYNFPVDPTPTTKASIKPGPIEHGTPLNPYIPKPPSPSSSPPPQQSQDGG
jgi:hypothetical protein